MCLWRAIDGLNKARGALRAPFWFEETWFLLRAVTWGYGNVKGVLQDRHRSEKIMFFFRSLQLQKYLMKSLQIFRTWRSSRDLLKNDILGSYFKNRVPYPPLISKKTENYGSPTTRKMLVNQWILPILAKDFPDLCLLWAGDL